MPFHQWRFTQLNWGTPLSGEYFRPWSQTNMALGEFRKFTSESVSPSVK